MAVDRWEVRPLADKWFDEATPINYVAHASTTIGTGTNGTVTVTHNDQITSDKIEVKVATSASAALAAAYASGKITVTLGTDASSAADATKNTATLITAAINGITGKKWTAVASGTGASAISTAVTAKDFTNGHDATPCLVPGTVLQGTNTYYVFLGGSWKSFSLSTI